MVIKLSVMCLRSICDGVEAGRILGHHLGSDIPSNAIHPSMIRFRQRLLDLALIRGSIHNPNCLNAFTSPEFLDGLTSLNTTINVKKLEYRQTQFTERLCASLGTNSPTNAEITIGSQFDQLQLWANGSNLGLIGNIVSNCQNLRKLELVIGHFGTMRNAVDSARLFAKNLVVSQLEELSMDCYHFIDGIASNPHTIEKILVNVSFSNLRSLTIRGCKISDHDWMGLLQNVRSTLTFLDVDNFWLSHGCQLIPFAMERLRHLRIGSSCCRQWSPDILAQCRELAYLDVDVPGSIGTDQANAMIQGLNINLRVKVLIDYSMSQLLQNDQPPRFRVVNILGAHITSVKFDAYGIWNDQYATAMTNAFASCPNLRSFQFVSSGNSTLLDLGPLFDNIELQCLRQIELTGNIKVGKLFKKYIDLEVLALSRTSHIRNADLIKWTRMGGGRKLCRLTVVECTKLRRNGIARILAASGSTLQQFTFRSNVNVRKLMKRSVLKYCPFAAFEIS